MTVDELIDWLEAAKHLGLEEGHLVGDYKVHVPCNSAPIEDGKVNHGQNTVSFWSD